MPVTFIGESLNATIPKVGEAVAAHDADFVRALATRQAECGAHMLDLNAQVVGRDELVDLPWMVDCVQEVVDLPLMLDSSNPDALAVAVKGTEFRGGPPVLSSVTGEAGHAEKLLPLAIEHGCGLVALLMGDAGIDATASGRMAVCRDLVARCRDAGLPDERLWLDPLVLTIGTDTGSLNTVMEILDTIRSEFPGVRTACGASNVSFGMPDRPLINRVAATMLASHGMQGFIVNVRDEKLMHTLRTVVTLVGEDPMCMGYMKHYRAGRLDKKPPPKDA